MAQPFISFLRILSRKMKTCLYNNEDLNTDGSGSVSCSGHTTTPNTHQQVSGSTICGIFYNGFLFSNKRK